MPSIKDFIPSNLSRIFNALPTAPAAQAPAAPTAPAVPTGPLDQFTAAVSSFALPSLLGTMPVDAASVTEASLKATSDDQLLSLAQTPEGAKALKSMANTLKQGALTPERQKQLDRIDAATFTPSASLQLQGSKEDKATYVKTVRQTMLASPSFAGTMKEINASKTPIKINLDRNSGTKLDSFRDQNLDLSDLEKLPVKPTDGKPEEITQGAVLTHMMREQLEKSKQTGEKDVAPAHAAAIESENAYRRDIGQKSQRLAPPNDETRAESDFGSVITVNYDDGHHDALLFNADGNLTGTAGFHD